VKVMVKRASEGMTVRYGLNTDSAGKLEGSELASFMTTLNEYLGFFDQVAKRLRDAHVYVSTGVREGLGLPPLEAMAAGCLVVGFAGGGGLDYARADNGVWVPDEDAWALADTLARTLAALLDPDTAAPLEAKRHAGRVTAQRYTRAEFERNLVAFWTDCLRNA